MSKLARYCLAVGAFAVMSVSGQAEACDGDPSGLTRNCGAVVAPPEFIQISSCGDLQKIGRAANYPLHGRYRLDNDIDLTECSAEWEPVGRSAVSYRTNDCGAQNCDPLPPEQMLFAGAFTGSFDGNGYTIRGLKTERVDPVMPMDAAHVLFILSAGLFGALDGARVDNLTIEADTVAVHGTYAQYSSGTGILAGYSRLSAVTGVNVTGTVAAYLPISNSNENFRLNAGGLIGNSVWDEITRCGSAVTVISEKNTRTDVVVPFDKVIAGGLVGTSEHATIRESRSTVTMTGELGTAGGLVGENNGGVIAKSGADMRFVEFLSKFEVLGGLVGFNKSYYGGSCPGCMDLRLQTGKITE
ncbi:MAG: hypothetical protein FWB94_12515, partial [Chitinispirillia bacterium]|nr:hypothetical protein [Chitinispirillia bacterium]